MKDRTIHVCEGPGCERLKSNYEQSQLKEENFVINVKFFCVWVILIRGNISVGFLRNKKCESLERVIFICVEKNRDVEREGG